ncbi:MAG: flavin reductase [Lachnospiraceae bacterium]|jgi:flavin reductase (DIM6/NTAB) family NADH-FMN oxidoreductase RutF|nr:flavin reductase [Lachnospiraceae bacterium]
MNINEPDYVVRKKDLSIRKTELNFNQKKVYDILKQNEGLSLQQVTVYVREHRYTKLQLDETGEFSISIPMDKPIAAITKVCGTQSGREVDKEKAAHLTLEEPEVIHVPGIKEYALTLECRILYSQKQEMDKIPSDIREQMYPQDVSGTYCMANQDAHTAYIGEIVAAYIIR